MRGKKLLKTLLSVMLVLSMIVPQINRPKSRAAGGTVMVAYYIKDGNSSSEPYSLQDSSLNNLTRTLLGGADGDAINSTDTTQYTLGSPSLSDMSFVGWFTSPSGAEGQQVHKIGRATVNGNSEVCAYKNGADAHYPLSNYTDLGDLGSGKLIFAKFTYSGSTTTTVTVDKYFYNVVFNANGGSGEMDSVTMAEGSTYVLPECGFTGPSGASFNCWLCDGKKYAPGDTVKLSGNMVFKASWDGKYILKGEPKWTWTPEDAASATEIATKPTAEVTINLVSSTNPNDTKEITYKGDKVTVTADPNNSATSTEWAYTARVTGPIEYFFEKEDSLAPVKASDLISTKYYRFDVLYSPVITWINKWPVTWKKGTAYPEMTYKVTYTSKKDGKKVTTEPQKAKVESVPTTIPTDAKETIFVAKADLSAYYTGADASERAKNEKTQCRYVFPKAGEIGYSAFYYHKKSVFTWPGASNAASGSAVSASAVTVSPATSSLTTVSTVSGSTAAPVAFSDPVVTAKSIYTVVMSEYVEGSDPAKYELKKQADETVDTPVVLSKETFNDGKRTRYTASITTIDGQNITESKSYDTDPESKTYGSILTGFAIEGINKTYGYTGSAINPAPRVICFDEDGGRILGSKEYSCKYANNKKVGTATLTVNLKNNYKKKTIETYFEITDKYDDNEEKKTNLVDSVSSIDISGTYYYNGKPQYPQTLSIKSGKEFFLLVYDRNEGYKNVNPYGENIKIRVTNNIESGKAVVFAKGSDGKEKKNTFKINSVNFKTAPMRKDALYVEPVNGYNYSLSGNNSKVTPKVKVSYYGTALLEDKDYSLTYNNNSKPGVGSVTISGKGNYSGKSGIIYFQISKFDLGGVDTDRVTFENLYAGNKVSGIKPRYVCDELGFEIPYSKLIVSAFHDGVALDNKTVLKAGDTLTLRISAKKDNLYTGYVDVITTVSEYRFVPSIKVDKDFNKSIYFSGTPIRVEGILDEKGLNPFENGKITLKQKIDGVDTTLIYGVDYIVSHYEKNVEAGTMIVWFKGIGRFSGVKSTKIKIIAKSL